MYLMTYKSKSDHKDSDQNNPLTSLVRSMNVLNSIKITPEKKKIFYSLIFSAYTFFSFFLPTFLLIVNFFLLNFIFLFLFFILF
jgi:hypothetical protein